MFTMRSTPMFTMDSAKQLHDYCNAHPGLEGATAGQSLAEEHLMLRLSRRLRPVSGSRCFNSVPAGLACAPLPFPASISALSAGSFSSTETSPALPSLTYAEHKPMTTHAKQNAQPLFKNRRGARRQNLRQRALARQ